MKFDSFPQSLCNLLPVFSTILYPAHALMYPCFFVSKQFKPVSDQTSLWQLWFDKTPEYDDCIVVAGTPYFVVSEHEQSVSELTRFIIHANTNTQFQNFNGNTMFAFCVAIEVLHLRGTLKAMRILLLRSWLHLIYQNFAAVPVQHKWQLPVSAPKQGAVTAVACNLNAAKKRFRKPDKFRVKRVFNTTNQNSVAQGGQKLQLYQVDSINQSITDDWVAKSLWASCRAQLMRLFFVSFRGLILSFNPCLWQCFHRSVTYLHSRPGFSAERNNCAASAQSWEMTTHLRLSKFVIQPLQRQVTAVAAACRLPIFAVIRHQLAALRDLQRLHILDIGSKQQKIPVTQKYLLKASHCFE